MNGMDIIKRFASPALSGMRTRRLRWYFFKTVSIKKSLNIIRPERMLSLRRVSSNEQNRPAHFFGVGNNDALMRER